MDTAIPLYTEAYQLLLRQLDGLGQDPEAIFTSLDRLRTGMVETIDRLEADRRSVGLSSMLGGRCTRNGPAHRRAHPSPVAPRGCARGASPSARTPTSPGG